MKKIDKKIDDLEDRIYDRFEWESTLIARECLTETENVLFDYMHKIVSPKNPEQIREFHNLINKNIYYKIRRGVDLFMKTMSAQLDESEDCSFWFGFIDFVSETMFILGRDRGSDFIKKSILGENRDDWPNGDDPKWKEVEEADEKWKRDFKEIWDHTSLTTKKIFSRLGDKLEEIESNQEEFEIKETVFANEFGMYEFFAECISIGLSSPSKLDIYNCAMASLHNKEKTLLEIFTERKAEQK